MPEYKGKHYKYTKEGYKQLAKDKAKDKKKEIKHVESRRKEAKERASLPKEEAPAEFKEFVKDFGKRVTKEIRREPTTTS